MSAGAASVGPFAYAAAGCQAQPNTCSAEQAKRSPVRASRTVVRPGRKRGGTTLIFKLTQPTVLRITIVRVYPSCKRFGSYNVRAQAGVNRVRFRGRWRGRALPAGGYRLVVRARGAERDAAAVPIVIANGKTSLAQVRKARNGSTCSAPIADLGSAAAPAAAADDGGGSGGRLDQVKAPVAEVAGAVAGAASGFADRVTEAVEGSPLDDPFVLTIVGLFLLLIAGMGTLLLAQVVRTMGLRD